MFKRAMRTIPSINTYSACLLYTQYTHSSRKVKEKRRRSLLSVLREQWEGQKRLIRAASCTECGLGFRTQRAKRLLGAATPSPALSNRQVEYLPARCSTARRKRAKHHRQLLFQPRLLAFVQADSLPFQPLCAKSPNFHLLKKNIVTNTIIWPPRPGYGVLGDFSLRFNRQ